MNLLMLIPGRVWLYLALAVTLPIAGGLVGWSCHTCPTIQDTRSTSNRDTVTKLCTLAVQCTVKVAGKTKVIQVPQIIKDTIMDTIKEIKKENCYTSDIPFGNGGVVHAILCSNSFSLIAPSDLSWAGTSINMPVLETKTVTVTIKDTCFITMKAPWYENPYVCLAVGAAGGSLADEAIRSLTNKK